MCRKPSCSAKTVSQIRDMQEKLDTLSKSTAEKQSFAAFKDAIRCVWYDLAEGAAVSSTIYALAFLGKSVESSAEHLKAARKNFYIATIAVGVNELENAKKDRKKRIPYPPVNLTILLPSANN